MSRRANANLSSDNRVNHRVRLLCSRMLQQCGQHQRRRKHRRGPLASSPSPRPLTPSVPPSPPLPPRVLARSQGATLGRLKRQSRWRVECWAAALVAVGGDTARSAGVSARRPRGWGGSSSGLVSGGGWAAAGRGPPLAAVAAAAAFVVGWPGR